MENPFFETKCTNAGKFSKKFKPNKAKRDKSLSVILSKGYNKPVKLNARVIKILGKENLINPVTGLSCKKEKELQNQVINLKNS